MSFFTIFIRGFSKTFLYLTCLEFCSLPFHSSVTQYDQQGCQNMQESSKYPANKNTNRKV